MAIAHRHIHKYMRAFFPAMAFLLFHLFGSAQEMRTGRVAERIEALNAKGIEFSPVHLFERVQSTPATDRLWAEACTKAEVLQYDARAAITLIASPPEQISIDIPSVEGTIVVDLQRVDIVTDDFILNTSDGGRIPLQNAAHYRGAIRGIRGSLVAISIFENELMGILGDASGDRVIGRFDKAPEGLHVLYHENSLRRTSGAVCYTPDDGRGYSAEELSVDEGERTTRCVSLYWEIAYDIVQNKGSVINATNYTTGLFNQSAALFDNDGIDVLLSELFVWNSASPYNATSSSGRLDQFGDTRTSFNGDLAHLIDLGNYGGIAWLNTLCSSTRYRMGYSGIDASYNNVPTFSWSVEVVTHEQGHNMGSKHTHACAWNGNNTAIDGCGQSAGYSEGNCAQGPIPASSVGGTIMSYCHLISAGIKFVNGFGPQPTAVITNAINGASCLAVCGGSCNPPTVAATVTSNSATISWSNVGAITYDLQWKLATGSLWTTVASISGTSHQLTGLAQGTTYNYRVLSNCAGSVSAWSATGSFTTIVPCTDVYEPNNSSTDPTVIQLPANLNALIGTSTDMDYYRFVLDQTANINIYLTNVPDDYDMRLLNSGGTQLAISQNSGTSPEAITYANAAAGTYYIYVYGWNGTFNAQVCYTLTASASGAQGCSAPSAPVASNITGTTADLTWSNVQGASSYNVQWKEVAAANWNTSGNIAALTYALSDLQPATDYMIKVRSNCTGGSSLYSAATNFTTLNDPCASGVRLNLQVWLDGAYSDAQQMMRDDLRVLGLVPLQEPYSAMGFTVDGTLSTSSARMAVSGNSAIVDWVLIELRSASNPTQIVTSRAGLLRRDGTIVAPDDGASQMNFCVAAASYFVTVRHRNHLACMTATAVPLSSSGSTLDLRSAGTATYGTNARRNLNGAMRLWAGNTNGDDLVKFSGQLNDRDPIIALLGGIVPTATQSGYFSTDVNMDGVVKYTGSANDRDIILQSVGGVVPTNLVQQQLP